MSKLEQVAYAAERFVKNGNTYTDIRITPEFSIDEKNALNDDFLKGFSSKEDALLTSSYYFVFSKWLLYKTVYRFDKNFLDVLIDTEDMVFHAQTLQRLPVKSFFITSDDKDHLGYFVYTETVNTDLKGNPVNDTVFIVLDISDVKGINLQTRQDALWISDGQKLSVALEEWMKSTDSLNFYDEAFRNMKMAIQVAYYLSAQNAVIKEVESPKARRHHHSGGKPTKLKEWDVGYRISTPFPDMNHTTSDAPGLPDESSTGTSPRPHIRRAHWHHFWAGAGKTELILKWLEPMWISGTADDIVAVEHRVE